MEVTLLIDQQNNLTNYSIAPSNHADWWLTSTCIHIAIACLMSSCFMSSCFMSSCFMSSCLRSTNALALFGQGVLPLSCYCITLQAVVVVSFGSARNLIAWTEAPEFTSNRFAALQHQLAFKQQQAVWKTTLLPPEHKMLFPFFTLFILLCLSRNSHHYAFLGPAYLIWLRQLSPIRHSGSVT